VDEREGDKNILWGLDKVWVKVLIPELGLRDKLKGCQVREPT
jgi:hypothetical protein